MGFAKTIIEKESSWK